MPRIFIDLTDIIKPVSDTCIGLPGAFLDSRQLALFDVEYSYFINAFISVFLCIDCPVISILIY